VTENTVYVYSLRHWAGQEIDITHSPLPFPFLRAYKEDPRFIAFAQKVGVMPKAAAKP